MITVDKPHVSELTQLMPVPLQLLITDTDTLRTENDTAAGSNYYVYGMKKKNYKSRGLTIRLEIRVTVSTQHIRGINLENELFF